MIATAVPLCVTKKTLEAPINHFFRNRYEGISAAVWCQLIAYWLSMTECT
jgi:hypothetical protein